MSMVFWGFFKKKFMEFVIVIEIKWWLKLLDMIKMTMRILELIKSVGLDWILLAKHDQCLNSALNPQKV